MGAFNGFRSWNAWNVSLWINNDEGLYALAKEAVNSTETLDAAAKRLLGYLEGQRTPDGAVYNLSSLRSAIEGYTRG
jgi:predicted NUDIX family NTP pyrophosphohydrolase